MKVNTEKRNYHHMVSSEEELLNLIRDELESAEQAELVVMAGHFMLFNDEESNCLKPGIIEEQSSELMTNRISRRVGIFPTYTWKLGIEIGKEFKDKFDETKFLLLINDWQYVPDGGSTATELRQAFYEKFTEIPQIYKQLLDESNVFDEKNILASRKHPVAFPETWLKYRFQKSAKKLVKEGKLEKKMIEDRPNQSEVTFVDSDGNYKTLISCGITGCAGEVTEMISEVHKLGHRLMLIFAPGECYSPVRTGIEIALNLYALDGMKIIIADPGGSGENSTQEIYEKIINFSVFNS
ncbi:LPD16 domain-containing protein [Halalkalibacter urbisdiaboli]|uniref:LPD16 domain-containing protein n=1 Tax=Halalkalibacter urbisdiaboli TaxID=1960589 RepID=UPI000B447A7E|nr:LPD16 domain-containing protein [Halalkalibacter urbisdiaboli]